MNYTMQITLVWNFKTKKVNFEVHKGEHGDTLFVAETRDEAINWRIKNDNFK